MNRTRSPEKIYKSEAPARAPPHICFETERGFCCHGASPLGCAFRTKEEVSRVGEVQGDSLVLALESACS